jgi:hypothetical protein
MSEANGSNGPYHPPSEKELAFLRIVTRGYPNLEAQVESCEVEEYDETGYCNVRVLAGPRIENDMANGPTLVVDGVFIETILWFRDNGWLDSVEVVEYAPINVGDVYQAFIDAVAMSTLVYRDQGY